MYPLRFKPIFRRYIWGGNRLATTLGKQIGDQTCAESWEIVDHNQDQSIVEYGDYQGRTLNDLIVNHGHQLLGEQAMNAISSPQIPQQLRGRFPLLLKFLDANRKLSVQVHPNDFLASKLSPPDLGKTEAWFVMHADPGARIYAGLKPGVTAKVLREAILNNRTEETLHSFEANAGDSVFIPAGTVHAIGEGLLIAEIQQASDTTFRLFDWNRVDKNGQSRELHIEQGIHATNFDMGPISPTSSAGSQTRHAVVCDKFVMEQTHLTEGETTQVGGDNGFHIIAVSSGSISISGDPSNKPLTAGNTALLPAAVEKTNLVSNTPSDYLHIHLP